MKLTFANIRDVFDLGQEPKAYKCLLDLTDNEGTETVEYNAIPDGGGICDDVLAAIERGEYSGTIQPYIPPPVPTPDRVYNKPTLFDAMTDAEYATWEAQEPVILSQLTARQVAVWSNAVSFYSAHPLFSVIEDAMVAAYGAARTAELLAAAEEGVI